MNDNESLVTWLLVLLKHTFSLQQLLTSGRHLRLFTLSTVSLWTEMLFYGLIQVLLAHYTLCVFDLRFYITRCYVCYYVAANFLLKEIQKNTGLNATGLNILHFFYYFFYKSLNPLRPVRPSTHKTESSYKDQQKTNLKECRGNDLLTFASNYYLAHLAQSAQISGSELIPPRLLSLKNPIPIHHPPPSHPGCTLKPGNKAHYCSSERRCCDR